jgi:hypothetical protein
MTVKGYNWAATLGAIHLRVKPRPAAVPSQRQFNSRMEQ